MASRDPQRPNVLFVISDDQGTWALGCGGNPDHDVAEAIALGDLVG